MSGKGSGRRPCDEDKVRNNWDIIFGKKLKEQPVLLPNEKENENELRTKIINPTQ